VLRLIALLATAFLISGCAQTLVVIPAPEGIATEVNLTWKNGGASVEKPGYALYHARILDEVYRIDDNDFERNFGAPMATMREVVANGLPELPHSYLTLLPYKEKPLGNLSFQATKGTFTNLEQAGYGVYIDGYPDQPHPLDKAKLHKDFALALDALSRTLKEMRSYIILLDSPDGLPSKVIFHGRNGEVLLEQTGQSLTLDGIEYESEEKLAATDFGPARSSTQQILDAGLPNLPHSYAALIESPLGPLGTIEIIEGIAHGMVLDQPDTAVFIDGYSKRPFNLEASRLKADFVDSLDAMPPPPVTFSLYFESGGVALSKDSRAIMSLILKEIRAHPAADISIDGHTDTVGNNPINDQLSRRRCEHVMALLKKSGVHYSAVELAAFGKNDLSVKTPDNTPEPLNRLVEITIR
jgi:hypothetical protein